MGSARLVRIATASAFAACLALAGGSAETARGDDTFPEVTIAGQANPGGPQAELPLFGYEDALTRLEDRMRAMSIGVEAAQERLKRLLRILRGTSLAARASARHVNHLGSDFEPVSVRYLLDGVEILAESNPQALQSGDLTVLNRNLPPGLHRLQVELVVRGNSPVFRYLRDFRITLRSGLSFAAVSGKMIRIRMVAFERGDPTLDFTQRPWLRFDVEQVDNRPDNVLQP